MKINDISASFSCFAFISPKLARILKYLHNRVIAWLQLLETILSGDWQHPQHEAEGIQAAELGGGRLSLDCLHWQELQGETGQLLHCQKTGLAENWTGRLSDCQTVTLSHCQTVTGLPTQAGTTGWDWPAITLAEHWTGRLSDCQTGRLWLDCLHWQRNYRVIQASSYTVRKLDWQNLEYQSLVYHNLEF